MNKKRIDLETYPRAAHFRYFQAMASPYVGLTVNVDITDFLDRLHAAGAPFFLSLLYCAVRAANAVPALRQRIDADGIVEYDNCRSSHTVAKEDGTYCYCVLSADRPFAEFLPDAVKQQAWAKEHGDLNDGDDFESYLFVSSAPWLSFTSLIQPMPSPADSNPRIVFGKYFQQEGKTLLPVHILCNHALVDGRQIAEFYQALEENLRVIF